MRDDIYIVSIVTGFLVIIFLNASGFLQYETVDACNETIADLEQEIKEQSIEIKELEQLTSKERQVKMWTDTVKSVGVLFFIFVLLVLYFENYDKIYGVKNRKRR